MKSLFLSGGLVLACISASVGQDSIDPVHRYSWGENIGWMDWRDAGDPPGSQGIQVHGTFLSGFIWGENVGWINAGSGMPANGIRYANLDGSDYGVNIDGNGDLYGFAWGENIGWVQFDTRSKGSQRARLDRVARRFRGYAWGENVGWINLDDAAHFVGLVSGGRAFFKRGDSNSDRRVDISDVIYSLNCLFRGGACTTCRDAGDSNDDGGYDLTDAVHTLNWLFRHGPIPPPPGPFGCGEDPTAGDALPDCRYASCP